MRRHGSRAALTAAICALMLACNAPFAAAAPEVGDAGELPAVAQEPGPPGPLGSIDGTIATGLDRDVYKVCLTGGGDFSASTVGGATFDTQLFLLDSAGRGVYANDDHLFPGGGGTTRSELPAGHPLTPSAPGVYYLAISPYDWNPSGALGPIFPNSSSGVVGPFATRAALPVIGWSEGATSTRSSGGYTIALTGARSCLDGTPPSIQVTAPADGAEYERGAVVPAAYSCADEPGGSELASCVGPVLPGEPIDTSTEGEHEFTVTARDHAGNVSTKTVSYRVVAALDYGFEGFLWPLAPDTRFNTFKAGKTVPIRFRLNDFYGRGVIAYRYPRSEPIHCDTRVALGPWQPTRGSRRPGYNEHHDFYVYRWRTEHEWAGTCRRFVLGLDDRSVHEAFFRFPARRTQPDDDND